MAQRSLSIRAEILLFAAALSILPFAGYGLWTYLMHSRTLYAQEEQTARSYSLLITNSIAAQYYGFINEQLQSLTQLRRELSRTAQSLELVLKQGSGSERIALHAASFDNEVITAFIYDRDNPEQSFNLNLKAQDLLHALDMRGQPLSQHVRADALSPQGFYFYLQDSAERAYVSYVRPADDDLQRIICITADVERIRRLYDAEAQYGLIESFDLLMENIPPDEAGDIQLLGSNHELLSSASRSLDFKAEEIPAELFAAARAQGTVSGQVSAPDDTVVQLTYIKELDWYLLLAKPVSLMESHLLYSATGFMLFCVFFAIVGLSAALAIAHDIRRRIQRLAEAADAVTAAGFNSPEELLQQAKRFSAGTHDESREAFHALKRMLHALYHATSKLLRRTASEKLSEGFASAAAALKRSQLTDLDALRAVLPASLQVEQLTCPKVGGDFYEVLPLEGSRAAVICGTVTGQGIQAAGGAAMCLPLLRQYLLSGESLERCALLLNRALRAFRRQQRLALFLGIIDFKELRLTSLNAGACRPWLLRADGTLEQSAPGSHSPLGAAGEREYRTDSLELAVGDVLLCFTAGLFNARNADEECFGFQRLQDFLSGTYRTESCAPRLLRELNDFRAGTPLPQDLTILTLQIKDAASMPAPRSAPASAAVPAPAPEPQPKSAP